MLNSEKRTTPRWSAQEETFGGGLSVHSGSSSLVAVRVVVGGMVGRSWIDLRVRGELQR
jgi:hypothetical protein